MQARKKGKYQRKKMEGRVGEQKKIKPKLLDAVRKKQNEIQNPSEKPPTFTGRVDPTKGAPTPKRTTFKKQTKLTPENQFEDAAPTNSMGGGAIAGSVEAGDNPPVKKKKKTYAYGGRGSRKMWMNNK